MDWDIYIKDAVPTDHANTLYLNPDLAEMDELPGNKSYSWVDRDDFERRITKEGRTKNKASKRVSQYEAKKRKFIIDIIVDERFKPAKSDQHFNSYRSEDTSYPAKLFKDVEATSEELMQYNSYDDLLNISALRREYLQKWLDDTNAGRDSRLSFRFTSADVLNKLKNYLDSCEKNDPIIGLQIDTRGGKELLQIVGAVLSNKSNIFFGSDFYASFGGLLKSIYKFSLFKDMAVIDLRKTTDKEKIEEL